MKRKSDRMCFAGACALDPNHEAHVGACPGTAEGAGTQEIVETLVERVRLLRLATQALAEEAVMSIANVEDLRTLASVALDLEHVITRLRRAMEHESLALMVAEQRAPYRTGGAR